ncbi:MAG: tail fiber domain-containing protein [Myxococcales bacterium]|nr:tail fiber domain-containing protein [Myxococcales bacterium]
MPTKQRTVRLSVLAAALMLATPAFADQVINTDLAVQGSACVGFDCSSSTQFGYDTIRLSENNLRIRFHDTSSSSAFPSADWELRANDTTNGGANYFGIVDIDSGTVPFRVQFGAPNDSVVISSSGAIGVGTRNPLADLHVTTADSPFIRLEQDSTGGWSPRSWDIAANETSFFVRDVQSGLNIPFRIRAGAPRNAMTIESNGYVGLGTGVPSAALHVFRSDGNASVLVEEAGEEGARDLLTLANNGPAGVLLEDTSTGAAWRLTTLDDDGLGLDATGNGSNEVVFHPNGEVTILGVLNQGSNRDNKEAIVPVDSSDILARLEGLEISEWSYIFDGSGARHVGPMAQDFHRVFGLGSSPTGISSIDSAGVALAAIQALVERNRNLESRVQELSERLDALGSTDHSLLCE